MRKILYLILIVLIPLFVKAQAPTYINTNFNINAGVPTTWYGDVTFGPDAVVYLEDGAQAIFYGKNMVVNPTAKFICLPGNSQTGTGRIIFRENNPLYPNYPLQQNLNGGYSVGLDPAIPNIDVDNVLGISLNGNTRVTNTVKFTKGHVYLNNFNLVLDNDAIFSNYNVNQHVVTNGTGVVVKEDLPLNASFLFPISIAGLDYTPATITNTAATRNINVQVKDYATSAANETTFATKGMDRTWQISSNIVGAATVSLQHNSANNTNGVGTNESMFYNAMAYVSQQITTGIWSDSIIFTDGGSPISTHVGNNLILPSTVNSTAYFTKQTKANVDLMVTKSVNNAVPSIGSNLTFTIIAKNLGILNGTGVKVQDLLPSGYLFVSSTATAGSYNPATGLWTIGNLNNGATETLTITATVNATGSYANTAVISGIEFDPDLINNTSTVTPTPGVIQANLGVVKTSNITAPTTGNNVIFTIAANNAGPNNATGVTVTDLLSAGYVYVSATASVGSYNNVTGLWTIGNFANGANATLTITAKVAANGPFANTATIGGNELDPVPANNTSTITLVPNASAVDLSITKTAPIQGLGIGDEFDYTLVVKNIGTNLANNVISTDILPAGLTYISTNTTYGTTTYSAATNTVVWSLGSLAVNASATLTIRVKANTQGTISNTATVTSAGQDVNLVNNTSAAVKDFMDLKIANVITPDGDGKNDSFTIIGINAYSESNVVIVNRWGNEVFHSTGTTYKNEWTGQGLNEGTYYYLLKIKDKNAKWQSFTGSILLIRP